MKIVIDISDDEGITLGDITSAKGAIIDASTGYVDWEKLYNSESYATGTAISGPGRILLAVAHQLGKEDSSEQYQLDSKTYSALYQAVSKAQYSCPISMNSILGKYVNEAKMIMDGVDPMIAKEQSGQ